MPAPSDDQLQQYFDGELTDAEANAIERELDADEARKAKLEGLRHLHDLVVTGAEARADELDSGSMWAALEARLGEEAAEDDDPMFPAEMISTGSAPARPKLGVIAGGKAESKAAERARARPPQERRMDRHRHHARRRRRGPVGGRAALRPEP